MSGSGPNFMALEGQVGGNHYQGFAIEPAVVIHANGFSWIEGNIIKYVYRHKAAADGKEKQIEDLQKIIDYAIKLLALEHGIKWRQDAEQE